MPSLVTPARTVAAIAVLVIAANVDTASASAKTHTTSKSHTHRLAKTHKPKHHRHEKKTHKVSAPAHAASVSSTRRKPTPTKRAQPTATTTTPTATTTTTTPTTTPQPVGISGSWNLVLDSEFSGSSLNTSVWQPGWYGTTGFTGPVNSSETACYSPSNVTFPGDGTMHLSVTHTPSTCGGVARSWTGSIVTTNPEDGRASGGFQYTYGVAEARVYIPSDGTQIANWPAFWTDGQSWPADGEDDIMEAINNDVCSTFHDPLGTPHVCNDLITPGWHTFASDWQPGSVTYYYDGVKVGTVTTGVTTAPMYLILDNTVDSTDYSNNAADAMQVQYVRVWQTS